MSEKTASYFTSRLESLGITSKVNSFTVPFVHKEPGENGTIVYKPDPEHHTYKNQVFETDEKDNIRINYYDLTGRPYEWKKEGERSRRKYFRTRLKYPTSYKDHEGVEKEMKYAQAKGSGLFPFFPPAIINKFIHQKKIETLVCVEGEFKAFKGSMHDMDIIGLPSIHGFYSNDVKGAIHEDIQELILVCEVKKLVFLTDADTLSIRWEDGKDLKKRANSFYTSVKNFRNSLQTLIDSDYPIGLAYFIHLRSRYNPEAKGLDDLLVKYPKKAKEIHADLLNLDLAKSYFQGKNISDNRYSNTLFNYFGLNNVERFYEVYKEYIGSKEFRFGKSRFQWNGEEVVHVRHEDADQYLRVGSDWMKVIKVPNKNDELEEEIIPFKISEITRDYKKYPDFIDQLQRYDAFCNIPNWNGHYRRKYGECYNICNPINWKPKNGSIDNTLAYLKHLFGGEGFIKQGQEQDSFTFFECGNLGDPFTVALDYLTLLYQKPTHKLPVPILVSPEQGTGKSTFLKWLRSIYGSNATILDNDRFKMNFNAHYITKFIIGLDEGFLDIEKKAEKEKLKQIATADEAFLENKGMNLKRFPYYGKLIICSNDADKVMQMDTEDRRWFVVRVPKLKEKDPMLEEKMRDEIPAFLDFLANREVFHPKEDDLWFKTEYIITEQFLKIVEVTKSRIDKVVESYLKELFLNYRMPVLRIDLKTMLEHLNDPKVAKYKIDEKDLVYYLEERRKLKREPTQRIKIPYGFDENMGSVLTNSKVARPFIFRYEDWLNTEELEEFNTTNEIHRTIEKKEPEKVVVAVKGDLNLDQTDDMPF